MAQGDPQGWESLGVNDPLLYKANLRLNRETGSGQIKEDIRVVTNRDNGNYDVYRTAFGASDQKLFGYNASDNKIVVDPNNKATYDQFFTGPRSQQLTNLNKSVKQATLKLAENNVSGGSNSTSQAALNRLKQTPGYKSIAAAPAVALPPGTNPNGADPGAGAPIDGAAISKAVGVKEGTRNKFPGAAGEKPLVYPITLKNELQDVIKFSMIQYRPKTYSSDKFGYGERTRLSPTIEDGKVSGKDTQIIGTVVLPIPNGISDSNAVTWGGADSNAAQAAIGSVVSGSITNGVSGGADAIGNLVKTVYKNTPEVQAAITGLFVDNATQQQGFLARTAGLIINPNLELLFSAPTLRPFNFTFKLASRSPKESETIRSIIRFFKQGMSPIRSQSNLFLKAPHTFQIQYLHRGGEHKFLNKFKECALQSFSVNYTPEGQYATFNDGAMVSYQITMQFSELEPVFNDDYEDGIGDKATDTEIGF
jgi:hypothetical protein